MLCLKLKHQTVDLMFPRNRQLVLIGPHHGEPRIEVRTPGREHQAWYAVPAPGRLIYASVAGLAFGMRVLDRGEAWVAFEIDPHVEITRRPWKGKRAS